MEKLKRKGGRCRHPREEEGVVGSKAQGLDSSTGKETLRSLAKVVG
jgi:hypothetical protein